jgi:hypothetical protein
MNIHLLDTKNIGNILLAHLGEPDGTFWPAAKVLATVRSDAARQLPDLTQAQRAAVRAAWVGKPNGSPIQLTWPA